MDTTRAPSRAPSTDTSQSSSPSLPSTTPAAISSFFSRVQAILTPRGYNARVDDIMHFQLSDARENTLFTDDPEKVKRQSSGTDTTTGWHKLDDRKD